jgi:sugar O-acyltransferase (sialic acid O-acetyltransferase NeuD family)
MIKSEILVPLLNANEPEARVVGIHVKDAQSVDKGLLLFTIETTKTSNEIDAPEGGFIRLLVHTGDLVSVGERLAVITGKADEPVNLPPIKPPSISAKNSLRITKPAKALAESLGVDLSIIPPGGLVTEAVIRQAAREEEEEIAAFPTSDKPYLLLYGAGGHAKSIMEIVLQNRDYTLVGIVDDNIKFKGKRVLGIPVLGTRALLPAIEKQGVLLAANGVGGIIDIGLRVGIFELLETSGFSFPTLVHPRATLEISSKVEQGVQVFANAYVGADAVLHARCMINTNAVVSHDCEIGAYTHVAPGALLAGQVRVGERTLIGMGVTTTIGIKIGSGVRIGNAAIVLADVPDKMVIQAGRYWVGKVE